MFRFFVKRKISLVTCTASSLVGTSISVLWFIFLIVFSMRGMRKAAVLPVPVSARAMTSLFFSMCGMIWSCIGVGMVIFSATMVFTSMLSSPKVLNVFFATYFSTVSAFCGAFFINSVGSNVGIFLPLPLFPPLPPPLFPPLLPPLPLSPPLLPPPALPLEKPPLFPVLVP